MQWVSLQDGANFRRNMATIRGIDGFLYEGGDLTRDSVSPDLPRSLDDLLIDISIDDPEFGPTLERLARGAADMIEARTAHVMRVAEYTLTLSDWWIGPIEINRTPLREVIAVEYQAARDDWIAVDPAQYWVSVKKRSFILSLLDGFAQPPLWQLNDCIRIRFSAGYDPAGTTGTGVDPKLQAPDEMLTAWTMLIAHFYAHRELFAADKVAGQVVVSAGSLLDSVRTFW